MNKILLFVCIFLISLTIGNECRSLAKRLIIRNQSNFKDIVNDNSEIQDLNYNRQGDTIISNQQSDNMQNNQYMNSMRQPINSSRIKVIGNQNAHFMQNNQFQNVNDRVRSNYANF